MVLDLFMYMCLYIAMLFNELCLCWCRDDLREHLKNVQKQIMAQKQEVSSSDTSSSDSESDSS